MVAIRAIETDTLLFFTQQKTRKVAELINNPSATLNFFLALQQRQIVLEGIAQPIFQEENKKFWETLPRERQLRLSAYAPTSGQVIQDLNELENKKRELSDRVSQRIFPHSFSQIRT